MIDRAHELPLTRQAALIGISRSAVYYQAVAVSERDLALMRRIDELHLEQPFWGSRGLLRMLLRDASIQPWIEQQPLGRKHVSTLMRRMGIEAQCPKPGTSRKGRGPRHQVFPYLLGGVDLSRIEANTLWALDTTYIPMRHGRAYLTAVIDVAEHIGWYNERRPHSSNEQDGTPKQAYDDSRHKQAQRMLAAAA